MTERKPVCSLFQSKKNKNTNYGVSRDHYVRHSQSSHFLLVYFPLIMQIMIYLFLKYENVLNGKCKKKKVI
jgi:hypothetical protein